MFETMRLEFRSVCPHLEDQEIHTLLLLCQGNPVAVNLCRGFLAEQKDVSLLDDQRIKPEETFLFWLKQYYRRYLMKNPASSTEQAWIAASLAINLRTLSFVDQSILVVASTIHGFFTQSLLQLILPQTFDSLQKSLQILVYRGLIVQQEEGFSLLYDLRPVIHQEILQLDCYSEVIWCYLLYYYQQSKRIAVLKQKHPEKRKIIEKNYIKDQVNFRESWSILANADHDEESSLLFWNYARNLLLIENNPKNKLEILHKMVEKAENDSDIERAIEARTDLAMIYLLENDIVEATHTLEATLHYASETGNYYLLLGCLDRLGYLYSSTGKHEEALPYFTQAFELIQNQSDLENQMLIADRLANCYLSLKKPQESIVYYQHTLELALQQGDRYYQYLAFQNVGKIYLDDRHFLAASGYFQQSLALARSIGNQELILSQLQYLATSLASTNSDDALKYFMEALQLAQRMNNLEVQSDCFYKMGRIYSDRDDIRRAINVYEQALQLARNLQDRDREIVILRLIGNLYRASGDIRYAVTFYERIVALAQKQGNKILEFENLQIMVSIYRQYDSEKAISTFEKAIYFAKELKEGEQEAKLLIDLAYYLLDVGNQEDRAMALLEDGFNKKKELALPIAEQDRLLYQKLAQEQESSKKKKRWFF